MRGKRATQGIVTLVVVSVLLAPLSARAATPSLEQVRAGLDTPTPIADSARAIIARADLESAQFSSSRPGKGARCALSLTVFPLLGTFAGMLVGATGAFASGNLGDSAKGPVVVATVLGAALGIGLGVAVCRR